MKKGKYLLSNHAEGQLSIFMAMILIAIISLLGFIINVGLFVKAKINVQNAVDSAAYAGAAVQARLLSQIGYLNWEMRNNYKEWMFKYYVLGNLSNEKVRDDSKNPHPFMDFRPRPFSTAGAASAGLTYEASAFAPYNVPTVCLNFGSGNNICNVFGVPGLPRFESVGLPAISEAHEKFMNEMVKTKSKNCSDRSSLNFGTTMLWIYGAGGSPAEASSDAAKILPHRPGAWIRSVELGLRMRNLEMLLNRPPVADEICADGSGCTKLDELAQEAGETPLNERPLKAYWSAFSNLGGGSSTHMQIKANFKLQELAPTPLLTDTTDLGGFLIPSGATYPSGEKVLNKHYVDLLATPVNLVMFFTTFVARTAAVADVQASEGACSQSLTGVPIPGFMLGFVKNPKVITYYAVKGETKYIGLFYPFTDTEGVTLRAYAAAKPFGGRIGPRLFKYDTSSIKARTAPTRTTAYISALKITDPEFVPGLPIPFDQSFYVENSTDTLGGIPGSAASSVRYGIPNLVYDYVGGSMDKHEIANSGEVIMPITKWSGSASSETPGMPTDATSAKGLFDKEQFNALKSSMTDITAVSADGLEEAVINARRPTKYDALNYLVPVFVEDENNSTFDAVSTVNRELSSPTTKSGTNVSGLKYTAYQLYAPLVGTNYIYKAPNELEQVMMDYIKNNESSINKFLTSLKDVAQKMRDKSTSGDTSTADGKNYADAANAIHPAAGGSLGDAAYAMDNSNCAAASLASRFNQFFNASNSNVTAICGIRPVHVNMIEYLNEQMAKPNFAEYFNTTYAIPDDAVMSLLQTAYRPGPRQGSNDAGDLNLPFGTSSGDLSAQLATGGRNYYSTKFISIKKVLNATDPQSLGNRPPYSELIDPGSSISVDSHTDSMTEAYSFHNILQQGQLSKFGTESKLHY